jgi:hypothetical protein
MYQHDLKTRASDTPFHDMMLFLLAGLLETDDRSLLEDKLRKTHQLSLQLCNPEADAPKKSRTRSATKADSKPWSALFRKQLNA